MESHSSAGGGFAATFDFGNPVSVPALYQCAQLLAAATLFFWAYRTGHLRAHLAAAMIVGLIMLDDALEVHEAFGAFAEGHLGFPELLGLTPQYVGEIVFAAVLGVAVLAALVWA